jgi:hypothetical protein
MDPTSVTFLLVFLIAVALFFDLLNGMHDAANAIATVVSTRVLSPFYAVLWAAFFNFAAYFIGHYFGFEAKVASTIGKGLINPEMVTNAVIFGALMGAITWNVITWRLGIPSSSSHALVGGIIGAGVAKAGFSAIVWGGLSKTLIAIVLSPVTGFVLGILLVVLISWLFVRANPARTEGFFRKLQLFTSALYSIGHGSNDAQKTAGIIAVLLYADHPPDPDAGGLRRNRRGDDPVRRDLSWHPGLDHPHDHLGDCRGWLGPPGACCALGHCRPDRLGLDHHHPGLGGDGGAVLPDRRAVHVTGQTTTSCTSCAPTPKTRL